MEKVRKPDWLRKKLSLSATASIKTSLRTKKLNTVCESAHCPNISECFERNTATLMILGNICNRTCGFCAVETGKPLPPDPNEPESVAIMVKELGLKHAVITSVTRDDLKDGGAEQFAKTVNAIRDKTPGVAIELLVPDFKGSESALQTVLDTKPDILNHNIETVPSLYSKIRPQADFQRSIKLLKDASRYNITLKSGIMVGFGESEKELIDTMKKLQKCGVDIVTIGQYLQPSKKHAPVVSYLTEEWFARISKIGEKMGIPTVFAGPFVRSSYMADMVARNEV